MIPVFDNVEVYSKQTAKGYLDLDFIPILPKFVGNNSNLITGAIGKLENIHFINCVNEEDIFKLDISLEPNCASYHHRFKATKNNIMYENIIEKYNGNGMEFEFAMIPEKTNHSSDFPPKSDHFVQKTNVVIEEIYYFETMECAIHIGS